MININIKTELDVFEIEVSHDDDIVEVLSQYGNKFMMGGEEIIDGTFDENNIMDGANISVINEGNAYVSKFDIGYYKTKDSWGVDELFDHYMVITKRTKSFVSGYYMVGAYHADYDDEKHRRNFRKKIHYDKDDEGNNHEFLESVYIAFHSTYFRSHYLEAIEYIPSKEERRAIWKEKMATFLSHPAATQALKTFNFPS